MDVLEQNNYHVELDQFTNSTPLGPVNFANIIASSNPQACRQLVLACHYDSKMIDGFLGATDSAVPCAMLLNLSEKFSDSFRKPQLNTETIGLKFVFFDGEEAFVEWTDSDSLYGSRHLAAKWAKQSVNRNECKSPQITNELKRIDMLMVLDLIGSNDTSFVMYNPKLRQYYKDLQKYERHYLSQQSSRPSLMGANRPTIAFRNKYIPLAFISDDHVPFEKRGVPILSLLAHPFPKVWHTVQDNYNAIDFDRTRQILYVIEKFVANYN